MNEKESSKEPETLAEYLQQFPTVINVGSPIDPLTGEFVNDIQIGPLQLSSAAIATRAMDAYLEKMEEKRKDEEEV
jgi:hypothetical protein